MLRRRWRRRPLLGGGLYRRPRRTWLAIHSAEARDLASVSERDVWETLGSDRSSSGTSLCGAVRLAAALAYESACLLPATLLWVGT